MQHKYRKKISKQSKLSQHPPEVMKMREKKINRGEATKANTERDTRCLPIHQKYENTTKLPKFGMGTKKRSGKIHRSEYKITI